MGLSSSQGRLLMLTSRLSDIELEEIMISQRQNQLAWQSEKVAKEYNEAMNNYKMQVKVTDTTERTGYHKEDLNYDNLSALGYVVMTSKNEICLKKDEDGNWVIPENSPIKDYYNSETDKIEKDGVIYDISDQTEILKNPANLQSLIINGVLSLADNESLGDPYSGSVLESKTDIEYVLDTSDDAAAESKYNYETARISRQDNQLDTELAQLETQHEAILKEYDSVKELISNNVDRTFQLFKNG